MAVIPPRSVLRFIDPPKCLVFVACQRSDSAPRLSPTEWCRAEIGLRSWRSEFPYGALGGKVELKIPRPQGAGCDGRGGARDGRCQCGRRSRVVLTPRRWCQVGGNADDGGKKARSPGRARRETVLHARLRVLRRPAFPAPSD